MWKGLSWQTLTIVPLWPKSRVLSISKGREIHRPHQQLNPLLSLSTKSKMKLSSSLYRLVEKNKQRPNYLFIFAYRHYGNLKYIWSVSSMVPKSKLVLFVAFSILYYYGSYIGENGVIDLMGCSHVGDHGDGRSINLTVAVGKRNSKSAYVVACVTPHPLPRKFQRQE
jgi:hypothetical protein